MCFVFEWGDPSVSMILFSKKKKKKKKKKCFQKFVPLDDLIFLSYWNFALFAFTIPRSTTCIFSLKMMYFEVLFSLMFFQVVSSFQAPFGQVQDIAFLPGGEEFISAAEVLRRNSTDKGIMVWDFKTSAVMSNQIYQVLITVT